ncbi:hypothetical protein [Martelella radicis]|uniref:DUF3168 domain-containing protein n=1 Tax=Martelella radicis TaxID=1397476 RepID=A0A7W6P8I0_9HYPH|nr:hypothetical protein [Martelella radicis]MBB4120700.1 hypothetical protein [Martelella radicis]
MPHLRTQIFDAILARLSAIPEFAGEGKVKRARTSAIRESLLPALTITWAEHQETAEVRPCAGPNGEVGYDRRLPIDVIAHFKAEEPDIEFDRIAVLVETALGQAIKLDGLVIELTLSESRSFIDRATGIALGVGALTFVAEYKIVAGDPGAGAL